MHIKSSVLTERNAQLIVAWLQGIAVDERQLAIGDVTWIAR